MNDESEVRAPNRTERRAAEAQAKKAARTLTKKKFSHRAAAPEGQAGSLDQIGFMQTVAQNYRDATEKNEKSRGRLHELNRLDAHALQCATQIAFACAYMEAFVPKGKQAETFHKAIAMKAMFKFRDVAGEIQKPPEAPLIIPAGNLIIPG